MPGYLTGNTASLLSPAPPPSTNVQTIITSRGRVVIEGPVSAHTFSSLTICPDMNIFRPSSAQMQALADITQQLSGKVYIARRGCSIIGYVTFHRPDDQQHWGQHDRLIEMGGIEVARTWRRYHIATTLVKHAFTSSCWENYIIMSIECCRNWDLQESKLGIWEYRRMLDKLLNRVGFIPRFTTMYDILEHPANVLLARRGSKIGPHEWSLFNKLILNFK